MAEEERVKRLADFKARLQRRLEELREEMEEIQVALEFVDEALAERSFRRVQPSEAQPSIERPHEAAIPSIPTIPSQPSIPEAAPEISRGITFDASKYKQAIPLKSSDGTLLATMYIQEDEVLVRMPDGPRFSSSTPPFRQFLLNRVFEPMRTRDQEAIGRGEMPPERGFSYEVMETDQGIQQITIRNYGDERRLRELRTTLRWTLEKMYEKTRVTEPSTSRPD
ncbi:hypothetical protein KEJ36_01990 [Candidatus Bathyarchaeota archaeon]|nr:hypothetical protein [Candidatus Bathyarchaeota archaeon]MBS7627581.1 hypothetical protein [Candidatus Bathyarchaeota archaeon]